MEKLILQGGSKLTGEVTVSGSKNAALPILAATLLTDAPCVINNVPRLRDTLTMTALLESLGKHVLFEGNTVRISSSRPLKSIAHYDLVSTMRGSFCVLGPLLAKLGRARVSLPGGCLIGVRPVDLHLKGLRALGAAFEIDNGYVIAETNGLKGASIYLGGIFGSSVLATANVMMAAVLSEGRTIIESAACEPEIEDLGNFLNALGAQVSGHGTPRITVTGVRELGGAEFCVGPDRVEAGTFILLAGATHSNITVRGVNPNQLLVLFDHLEEYGMGFDIQDDTVALRCPERGKPVSVTTYPYPGFPTDLQAQFMALMAVTPGVCVITDKVFPDRFIHIAELNRMGANIRREGNIAIVEGVEVLHGAPVMASDLRASAALVIAALSAEGSTEINRVYHLERGYENLDQKLSGLGVRVSRIDE
ncbi:MAG: UDP-N-acetylglucosamine 1-carboxyvinyltransferase [Candidatus Omnitrophota bacterium]